MDRHIQLFIGKFLNGELETINPVLDSKLGYRYQDAEPFVDDPTEAEAFLLMLHENSLLTSEPCGIIACCSKCGSYSVDEVLGEKRKPSRNGSASGNSWRCLRCGELLQEDTLTLRPVFSYRFSREGIDGVSDQLLVRPLLEFLRDRGYRIESPGTLVGASEVDHTFDITAYSKKDEWVVALDFVISDGPVGEENVISMFAKVFDANPLRSILVVFPELTEKAKKLADQYEIDVVETHNLDIIWKNLRRVIPPVDEFSFETLDVMTLLSLPDHLRKTASVVCEKGRTTADEISQITKRARAVESGYLNQLVRMGYLKKERKGRLVLFSVIS
ncbi:MAG: hypothetical protein JSV18_00020 [Candidatus Bathyarchaeota archaeon]|nr:MAG: hypothetical protein JSV18_00020 [Candidatus Bathyarchaeota archaeon]